MLNLNKIKKSKAVEKKISAYTHIHTQIYTLSLNKISSIKNYMFEKYIKFYSKKYIKN